MSMTLATLDGRTSFQPGETISAAAEWELRAPPAAIEARLFWHTSGKGCPDLMIVQTLHWEQLEAKGRREFELRLPREPFSFSGKLISLAWAVELVELPSGESARLEIVVSPTGQEIILHKGKAGA
jgi:hypothetical protein